MVTTPWSENFPLQGIKFPRGGSSWVGNGLNNLGWETWVYELGPLRGQAHSFHGFGWGWNFEPPAWDRRSLLTGSSRGGPSSISGNHTLPGYRGAISSSRTRSRWTLSTSGWSLHSPGPQPVSTGCLLLYCGPPGCKLLEETTTSLGTTAGFGMKLSTWDRNQGFFHITKARKRRCVSLIMRKGLPLEENPLVLSHHCKGLVYSSPKYITLDAVAIRPNSLWNWPSLILFTANKMESNVPVTGTPASTLSPIPRKGKWSSVVEKAHSF